MNVKRLKFLSKSVILLVSMGVYSSANATTIILDNIGNSEYGYVGKGASVDSYGGYNYDTSKMVVSRSGVDGRYMNVKIYTNFAGQSGDLDSRVQYGDLLLSTEWNPAGDGDYREDDLSTSGTRWEYAFGLDDRRDSEDDGGVGRLYELNQSAGSHADYTQQFKTSNEWVGGGSRLGHAVTINRDDATGVSNYSRWAVGENYLDFTFDLLGTSLLSSEQIAFHWAMTCANDVIEGQVNYPKGGGTGGGSTVSEPFTIGLLLFGLGVIYYRKRRLIPLLIKK